MMEKKLNSTSKYQMFIKCMLKTGKGLKGTSVYNVKKVIKYYIYRARYLQITLFINGLINSIKENYKIQNYIANSKDEKIMNNFKNEWKKWSKLIEIS